MGTQSMVNLLGYSPIKLNEWFAQMGEKGFRAHQVMRWVHQQGCDDFLAMSNIAKPLRTKLAQSACVQAPLVMKDILSSDGTRKWLLDVGDGNGVECVFIPEATRGTLCISSQAGCALNCSFCSTGSQGFNRNLTTAEIVGQLWLANHLLSTADEKIRDNQQLRPVTNVVMMGMGEPLTNYSSVVAALQIMLDDNAYGLSRRRLTVSTSGIVPGIERLGQECPVALAVSLHAPTDELRDELVPINRKYPLRHLMAACEAYLLKAPRDFITFEYVMIAGVNDSEKHAKQLIALTQDISCKFNLIPFNPFPSSNYRRSSHKDIKHFSQVLIDAGIITTVRKTRGEDVDAACGQLAGQVQDKTRRTIMLRKIDQGVEV